MDDQVPETVRPLTRRELRALAAAAEPDDGPRDGLAGPAEGAEPDVVPDAASAAVPESEPVPAPGGAPREAANGSTWHDDVRWSLQRELPPALPPEPDEDDVRWDVPFDTVVHDETADVAPDSAPVRRPAWPAIDDVAGSPLPPPPAPPVDDGDTGEDGEPEASEASEERADGPAAFESWHAEEASASPPAPETAASSTGNVPVRRSVTGRSSSVAAAVAPSERTGPAAPAVSDEPLAEPAMEPVGPLGPVEVEPLALPFPVETIPGPVAPPLPTLSDLLAARPQPPAGPAELGWRGTLRRVTGGAVRLGPGRAELAQRASIARVQRSLDGPRTIVVINPKGGAHKTTATLLLAASFGQHRGGYTLAWDNNETRGTLGWRSQQAQHHNTAVNLLQDLERFSDPGSARVGDLDNYVRSQGSAQFDVLASDEDAASAASIDAFAFRSLHRTLSRFYRVMVVDTGNNMRASNWQAAVEAADQVVIVSTVREDTAQSAAWAIDALRATGHEDVVRQAVTVLSDPAPRRDDALASRLHDHFGQLTRTVLDVPYDPSLVGGTPLDLGRLHRRTREAWLHVAAAVADGLG